LSSSKDPNGKAWTTQSLANATGQPIVKGDKTYTPQSNMAKGGMIKGRGQTKIVHNGMTNNLKKMLKG
jgi:hypothetical protein